MVAAKNGRVLAFDNVSYLPPGMSDALCRLSTGGGFATRALYTDDEEAVVDVVRPQILNGITEFAVRGDFLDRSISASLCPIDPKRRIADTKLWSELEQERPVILAGLLDAVAAAMRNLSDVELTEPPRMADAAQWIAAAEPALPWRSGDFARIYAGNRNAAAERALDAYPIAWPLLNLGLDGGFTGTAQELLAELEDALPPEASRHKGWPKDASALSRAIARVEPELRARGIVIERSQTSGARSQKVLTIRSVDRSNNNVRPRKKHKKRP
jgi:hypothetical protein